VSDPLEVVCDGLPAELSADRRWYVAVLDGRPGITDEPEAYGKPTSAAVLAFFGGWVIRPLPAYQGPTLLLDGVPLPMGATSLAGTVGLAVGAGQPSGVVGARQSAASQLSRASAGRGAAQQIGAVGAAGPPAPPLSPPTAHRPTHPARGALKIGRPPADIASGDLSVAPHHADVFYDERAAAWTVRRVGGDVVIDGEPCEWGRLRPGQRFRAGSLMLELPADGGPPRAVANASMARGASVKADGAFCVYQSGDVAIAGATLQIDPGSFTLVIGPSGAGKTSFAHALLGELRLVDGSLTVDGVSVDHPMYRRATSSVVRLVPQGDAQYERLTVKETLEYAAALRAERGTSRLEMHRTAQEVADKLELGRRFCARVETLSGGERRRLSIATEFVARPRLLILDEPTSGLDPGKELTVMASLRRLAAEGTTVLCITHNLANLDLADQLVMVGADRSIFYAGPPAGPDALGFDTWAEAMQRADSLTPKPVRLAGGSLRPGSSRPALPLAGKAAHPKRRPSLPVIVRRQVTLTRRRGRLAFASVLGIAVLGAAMLDLADPQGLANGDNLRQGVSIATVFAGLIGLSLGYTELVVERPILVKDWRIGVSAWQFVLAKFLLGSTLASPAAAGLGLVLCAGQLGGSDPLGVPAWAAAIVPLVLLAEASLGLGILLAAVAKTLDKAVVYSTALTGLQIALNGVTFAIPKPLEQVTLVLPMRNAIDALMAWVPTAPQHPTSPPHPGPAAAHAPDPYWSHSFFHFVFPLALLAVVVPALCAAAALFLNHRLARGSRSLAIQ